MEVLLSSTAGQLSRIFGACRRVHDRCALWLTADGLRLLSEQTAFSTVYVSVFWPRTAFLEFKLEHGGDDVELEFDDALFRVISGLEEDAEVCLRATLSAPGFVAMNFEVPARGLQMKCCSARRVRVVSGPAWVSIRGVGGEGDDDGAEIVQEIRTNGLRTLSVAHGISLETFAKSLSALAELDEVPVVFLAMQPRRQNASRDKYRLSRLPFMENVAEVALLTPNSPDSKVVSHISFLAISNVQMQYVTPSATGHKVGPLNLQMLVSMKLANLARLAADGSMTLACCSDALGHTVLGLQVEGRSDVGDGVQLTFHFVAKSEEL